MKMTENVRTSEILVGHNSNGTVVLVIPEGMTGQIGIKPDCALQIAAALVRSTFLAEGKDVPCSTFLRLPR